MNNTTHILQSFQRRLSRLSGSSRSLRLFRLTGDEFLDVSELQGYEIRHALLLIEALLNNRGIKLCELTNSRIPDVNRLGVRLKKLLRAANFLTEERGTMDLHIGWPMVRGKFADGTPVSAPLLFFPVRLEHDRRYWKLYPRSKEGIFMNRNFLLAYYHYQQILPDEELIDYVFDDPATDTTVFRTQLYQLLKDKLEIRFTPDIYSDRLEPFQSFSRKEFDQLFQEGQLKIFHQGVLGIFPQADSQLMPDYHRIIAEGKIQQVEDFFKHRSQASEFQVKEEKIFTPFSIDCWQEQALVQCKAGKSLVVHGPPGTGKSQLITNLIADALATGRRVLVVSQKRVALDVVYDRLQQAGLADFVARIHDFRHDLGDLYARLATHIERLDDYRIKNNSADVVHAERHYVQLSRTIDRLTEKGEEYKRALLDNSACGLSAKELYLTSSPDDPHIPLRQEYHYFHFSHLSDFLSRMRRYVRYASLFEQPDYPLLQRKSFARLPASARQEMEEIIVQAREALQQLTAQLAEQTGSMLYYNELEKLWSQKDEVHQLAGMLADETVYLYFQQMVAEKDDETSLLWLQNMQRVCMNCFDFPGVEATLRDEQMGTCQVALQERLRARKNFIRLIRWELFSEHKFFLKRVLVANNLPYSKKGLYQLEQQIDNRLNLMHHITALRQKKWLIHIPDTYNRRTWKKWFEKQEQAVRAKLLFSSLRELSHIDVTKYSRENFIRLLWQIMDELERFQQKKETWLRYLSVQQIASLSQSPGLWIQWVQQLRLDFDNLCAFDTLKENLKEYEKAVINRLFEYLQVWDENRFERVFQNSLRLAWIDYLELKYPVLRLPSTFDLEHLQDALRQAVAEKQKCALDIVLMRARERTYENLEYNRLQNRVTYRDLYHQVGKKRRRWPLRKLIATFSGELFQLVPCWMASPETVSAVFPLEQLFDVVVFDEASQCFPEYGLPAVYRGKQVLIAGDPKQLRPFDLYQVRFSGEEEEEPDLEAESLLSLAMRYLPVAHLHGHYRSQHPELIAFSNQHFYNNKLAMLPHRQVFTNHKPALVYRKIQGTWVDQTNEEEANEVVRLVAELSTQQPDSSLGVVTFNAPQQELILDKLTEQGINLSARLFVKNIENIQGDERDIIIFSIGYAPDKHGKVKLQFGSLNMPGGENRLNVAVTRARQQVIVVASLWPEELDVAGIKSNGPKLLRQYLEYVREVYAHKSRLDTLQMQPEKNLTGLAHAIKNQSDASLPQASLRATPFPFADLIAIGPDGYMGIIQTDDAFFMHHPVKSSWVYLPELFQKKEWPCISLHSRNWWADREQSLLTIKKFLHHLQATG